MPVDGGRGENSTRASDCVCAVRREQKVYLYDQWGIRIAACENDDSHGWHGWVGGNEDLRCPGVPRRSASPAAVPDVTALALAWLRDVANPTVPAPRPRLSREEAAALLALVERLTDERDRARAGCDDIYEMAKNAEAELERTRQERDTYERRYLDEREAGYQARGKLQTAERERDAAQERTKTLRKTVTWLADHYSLPLDPPHDPDEWHGGMTANIDRCPVCIVNAALAAADTPAENT